MRIKMKNTNNRDTKNRDTKSKTRINTKNRIKNRILNTDSIKQHHHQYAPAETMTLECHPKIEGYDFEQGLDFQKFLKSLASTGFQATHLAQGVEIVKAMRREKAVIFLA